MLYVCDINNKTSINPLNNKTMKTNSLKFQATKQISKDEKITVNIRLNDECNNGHQDFSITGEITKRGRFEMGGCIHEEIEKHFPEFKIFIDLHLADYEGVPMYAVENGFYHLENGFSNSKGDFKTEFCEYYRVTPEQFDELNKSQNKIQYAVKLDKLGILKQWKEEADKAIKFLEELTGDEFVVDSKKSQYHAPTPEQLKEEEEKQKSGFYTPEAKQERESQKIREEINKLKAAALKKFQGEDFFILIDQDENIYIFEGDEEEEREKFEAEIEGTDEANIDDNFLIYCQNNLVEVEEYEEGNYMVLTDEEADKKAKEYILDSVWAFNPSFLRSETGIDEEVFKAIQDNGRCESNNTAILRLIDDEQGFVDAAISADGRGHFMNSYDGNENEEEIEGQTFYIYRIN